MSALPSSRRAPLGGARAPIAVTGFGVASAAGSGIEPLIHAIESGKSHIAPLRNFDASDLPNERGADIHDEPEPGMARFTHYLDRALRGALDDADRGDDVGPVPRDRTGIALGTTLGLIDELNPGTPPAVERDRMATDVCVERAARRAGLGGVATTFSLACASSLCAVEQGCAELALDRADAMLVGGADTLGRFMQGGFCSLRGFVPESADASSVTIALGEAAAFAVLEPLVRAHARGAHPYAILESQRLVSDGYHLASPDPSGDGMARAAALAIDDAGLAPADIGAVVVTAIGSPFHEQMLKSVLERALGKHASEVPITTHELAVGHVLAASGVVVVTCAATLLKDAHVRRAVTSDALVEGFAHAAPRSMPLETPHVLTLSVGFGGFNGVAIVGAP